MKKHPLFVAFRVVDVLVGILLALSTMFQLLAMFGGVLFNEFNDFTKSIPWLIPVWAIALLLLIGTYLLLLLAKRERVLPRLSVEARYTLIIIASLIGALGAFVVALILRDALPFHYTVAGEPQGINTWRMIYRHMSSALAGVMIAIRAALERYLVRSQRRREQEQAAFEHKEVSTLDLDTPAETEQALAQPKKLKRSQKNAAKKEQNK